MQVGDPELEPVPRHTRYSHLHGCRQRRNGRQTRGHIQVDMHHFDSYSSSRS